MKKIITLITVLLLMFSITLTGCGGGTEEPAAAADPAVEEPAEADAATISREDLFAKYNECSTVFNEVEGILLENGTYDVEADVKAGMDSIYDLLDKAEVVVQSEDVTDEERAAVYDELQTYVDQMNGYKEAYM